jgi:uncharacterized RDD family membrane protein YckC
MNEPNPYAPPQTGVVPENTQILATPWKRLCAQFVDGMIVLVISVPLQVMTGVYSRMSTLGIVDELIWNLIGLILILVINWNLLQQGQTIGKKLFKLRIVRKDGSSTDRNWLISRRIAPLWVVSLIPVIGPVALLVDALCIFRAERNTLHDDVADTKVVTLVS